MYMLAASILKTLKNQKRSISKISNNMDVINTLGRRKASVARVYLSKGKGNITVNGKEANVYFPLHTLQYKVN